MKALRGVIVLVLALALSAPVLAADFEAGVEAYKRGDHATALKEWRPLAEQGDASAQVALGAMYFYGRGTTQDYAEAVKWYRLAAEQGQADAQHDLGLMYYFGHGVPQDYVQAHMWYGLAAGRSSPGEDRDQLISYRDEVEAKMSPEQIAEAERLAREWKPK